ncbi:MAG: MMPL family transporter, partial [Chitinivibrionales bacterium]|nr:MMPL family transporter [Chitinivibrionales bacterium]MBD3395000.1 MMPL family transporter [Chitinivibrionales bacterium]
MARLTDTVVTNALRFKWPVLAVTLLITGVFAYFATTIEINNDPTKTVPRNLQARIDYEKLQETFASPRRVLFIAQFDTATSFAARIDSMRSWGERFARIEGVVDVTHIGTMRIPVAGGFFGITSSYLVPRKGDLSIDKVRARIADSRELTGMFVSDDELTLSMNMGIDESENQVRVVAEVDAVQKEIREAAPARIYVTGAPMYAYFIDRSMKHNFAVLLPVCILVVSILLYVVFRRVSHVIASLAIIAVALVWTFGLLGISGLPFSVVTSIIPVILFPIGVATAIHVFRTHARIRAGRADGGEGAIRETFRELIKPILLSAITTFVGFASFAFSDVIWTRIFGIFTSIGVALALLLSIVLLPIVLSFDRLSPAVSRPDRGPDGGEARLWRPYKRFIFSPYWWLVPVAVIVAVGVLGFLRVRVEGNPIAMFPKDSDIRRSDAIVQKHLGGTRFLFILLQDTSGPMLDAEQWREVGQIVSYAESQDMVGTTGSLLPLIHKVSMMLSDTSLSDPALAMLLKGKGLLGKKLESSLRDWVSPDRRSTRIVLVCKNVEGTEYQDLARTLTDHITAHHPRFTVLVAGPPLLNDAMTYVLIDTQKQSLSLAFAAVFLVLCLLFRSLKVGLFSIIPIVLSTLFVYALLGFFGVAINVVTVIIVNTCIGIGIDYAIHFTAG